MLENSTFCSRLWIVSALVCAAVMSFITCSDAERASPTKADKGVKHNVLRRLYTPYSQHRPLFNVLPSTETGIQTGTKSETEIGGNYGERSSITHHRSDPLQLTYNQNIPDDRWSRAGITGARSEVRPASNISAGHSEHRQSFERQRSRGNDCARSQEAAQSRNSYHTPQGIIRKSPRKETTRPFRQGYRPSQVWHPGDAPKSYNEEKVRQPSDSPLLSPQAGRYWGPSPPTSRGRNSSYKEANELAAVDPWTTSSKAQSSKFFSSPSKTAPHVPSVSNSEDASLIKSNPSITYFSQGLRSASDSETPRHKKVQAYLFEHSQTPFGGHEAVNPVAADRPGAFSTEHRRASARVHGRLSSNFKQSQQSERDKPRKEHLANFNLANPPYHNANVAQRGAQTASFTKYQPSSTKETQAHPAPRSENSVVGSPVSMTATESVQAGRPTKTIHGFRGFKNPMWRAAKEPSSLSSSSSNERIGSGRKSFGKGRFEIANLYPSLSPKYSFGQRDAPAKSEKLERAPTDHSSPSPGTLDIVQKMTTPRSSFTLGFKKAQREGEAGTDRNPDRRRFKLSKRIYGPKEFGIRPLEGAKTLIKEPDKSARLQHSSEGFKLRSSQMWQPESNRIHRWYNKTEAGSSRVSTVSEPSSKDLKPQLKTAGSAEADTRFAPDKYRKNRKSYTHLGFQPVQRRTGNATSKTHLEHKEQNPATASASLRISSAYLGSAGDLEAESGPKSEPRPPNKTKPGEMESRLFDSSTRSTVRGKRVRGKTGTGKKLNGSTSLTGDAGNITIVRLPKQLARLNAVTYIDILGSASFSGVRATIQTPITPAVRDSFPNATATTRQKEGDNMSRGPEGHADGEAGFSSVDENKLAVGGDEVDGDRDASDSFPDDEGSGSGRGLKLAGDSLELDYLRISTGNISFKSVLQSRTEK